MSNVLNFKSGIELKWKENPTCQCEIHSQVLRIESYTNNLSETVYIVKKKQKNDKFKYVCSLDDEILMMLLDAKNVQCPDCD